MRLQNRSGFTLVELLISMLVGLVVLSGTSSFAMKSWQARRGWTVKESVDRNARFVGMSIARDAQEAGVSIASTPTFGTVGSWGDTLSILSVAYTNVEAPVYTIYDDGDTLPNYPAGGNCGTTCIEFNKSNGTFQLAAGDLVNLQIGTSRRLLLLTGASSAPVATRFRVNFLPIQSLLGRKAGLDSILLTRSGTTIQKLKSVAYWRDAASNTLYRATQFTSSGALVGQALATNTTAFTTSILFTGNREAPSYSGLDTDTLNDGNDIIGLHVRAQLKTARNDPAVNNGQPVYRWYDWKVAPRNLMYEKNR
jgi:prepilin-type N-terminal cleavage/methylation domain-containing protein